LPLSSCFTDFTKSHDEMGATHPPTNSVSLLRRKYFKVSYIAIVAIAVNKNTSEEIFIIRFSIALVITFSSIIIFFI